MATTHGMSSVSRRLLLGTGIGGARLLAAGCSVFDSGGGTGGNGGSEVFSNPQHDYTRTLLDAVLPVHADAL